MAATAEKKRFANLVKSQRESLGLTQEEVAAATGDLIAQRTVSDVERGHVSLTSLQGDRMLALIRVLKIPLSAITGLETAPTMHREEYLELPVMSMSGRGNNVFPALIQLVSATAEWVNPFIHIYLVETDEMTPRIARSQRIAVDTSKDGRKPIEGKIYLFDDGETYRLGRAREVESKYLLTPDNPTYKTFSWASVAVVGRSVKLLLEEDL